MSRFAAVAAALSLLVLGGLVGALGTHLFYANRRPPVAVEGPMLLRGPVIHRLERHLQLTPEQSRELRSILRQAREDGEALRHDVEPRLRRILTDAEQEIDAMLTPEQRRRFKQLQQRLRRPRIDREGGAAPRHPGWRQRRGAPPDDRERPPRDGGRRDSPGLSEPQG